VPPPTPSPYVPSAFSHFIHLQCKHRQTGTGSPPPRECCTQRKTHAGKGKLKNNAAGDLWFHCVLDFLLILSIGVGIWQLVAGAEVISPLLISVLWAVYSAIPPTLLLYYATLGNGFNFRILCK